MKKGRERNNRAARVKAVGFFVRSKSATACFHGGGDPVVGFGAGLGWQVCDSGRWMARSAPDFDVRQIDRYEATSEIVIGRGPKPANDPNAFNAREVIENIGPRVARAM